MKTEAEIRTRKTVVEGILSTAHELGLPTKMIDKLVQEKHILEDVLE